MATEYSVKGPLPGFIETKRKTLICILPDCTYRDIFSGVLPCGKKTLSVKCNLFDEIINPMKCDDCKERKPSGQE